MRGFRVFFLIFAGTRCAATVGPGAPDGGPASDSVMGERPSLDTGEETGDDVRTDAGADVAGDDGILTCSARLQHCDSSASPLCSAPCGQCQIALVVAAQPNGGRVVGGICASPPDESQSSCAGGWIARCYQNDQLCYGRLSGAGDSSCYDAAICLELDRLARTGARPGETADRCQWGDGTFAHTGQTAAARCVDEPLRTCGTGCAPCPSDRPICMFRSEAYPTGICMSLYFGGGTAGHLEGPGVPGYRCRISPEQVCPRGLACLIPVRNDVDMPDAQRWGRCYPPDVCQRFAASFSDGYRCLATLTTP